MSVTYLGSMNLMTAMPGLAEAASGLSKTISQINLFSKDKEAELGRALVDLEAITNVFNQARGLLDAGQALMNQAASVLQEAQNLSSKLLGEIGGAGVGMYRFDGDVHLMGRELEESMRVHAQGGTTVTAVILVASDGGAVTALSKMFKLF